MKKIYKYFLVIALTFSFIACSDSFFEFVPQDQATIGAWYRTEAEVRQVTATLYGRPWWSFTDVFQWCASDLQAGDLIHTWEAEGEFFKNSYTDGNRHILDGWRGLYNVISYANLIIDDMPVIAGGYGVSGEVINKGLGEARFFRGAAYFQLVEYWGEVPIIENPAAKVAANDLQPPKHTVSSIYEFIRRDLVYAAENLPATDDPGRVTSWAAKGMLAKLHLTLAQRGSAADFAIAADYAEDVIDNSGRVLFSSYENMFKVANEHNPEILWAIQCVNNGWSTGSSRQARFARHTAVTGDGTAWGGGKGPTLSFVDNLISNAGGDTDLRQRAIYMNQGDNYNYLATQNGGYTYSIVYRDEENVALNGPDPTLTAVKKHIIGNAADNGGYTITNQDSPFDIYMLRLADVYLLLAEAELGSGTTLSAGSGLDALNAVRMRAGLDPRTSATYDDIFNERRVEFGFESQGWIDVKRRYYRDPSGTLAYLNSQGRATRYYGNLTGNPQMAQENDPNAYSRVYSTSDATAVPPLGYPYIGVTPTGGTYTESINAFTSEKMILPIATAEVLVNPNLAPDKEAVDYF